MESIIDFKELYQLLACVSACHRVNHRWCIPSKFSVFWKCDASSHTLYPSIFSCPWEVTATATRVVSSKHLDPLRQRVDALVECQDETNYL